MYIVPGAPRRCAGPRSSPDSVSFEPTPDAVKWELIVRQSRAAPRASAEAPAVRRSIRPVRVDAVVHRAAVQPPSLHAPPSTAHILYVAAVVRRSA